MKVQCELAWSQGPWACVGCIHSQPHDSLPIRKSTAVRLGCDEIADYCPSLHAMRKCRVVPEV